MLVNIADYKNIARNVQYQNGVGCYALVYRDVNQTASNDITKLYSQHFLQRFDVFIPEYKVS
jgi:hypothetical protein